MFIDRRDLLHSLLRSAAGGVIVAITTCASVGAHEFEAGKITIEDPLAALAWRWRDDRAAVHGHRKQRRHARQADRR